MFRRIGTAPKGPGILLLFKEGEMAVSYWDWGWRSSIDECLLSNYYGEPVGWAPLPDSRLESGSE